MDEVRYGVALAILMTIPGALLYWFSIHPLVRFWRRAGVTATMAIHLLLFAAVAAIMVMLRRRLLAIDYGTSPLLIALAAPFLVASVALRRTLSRQLKLRALMGLNELELTPGAAPLIREGIYARLRHPRYVEIFAALLAGALFANYLAAYLVTALAVPGFLAVILLEEAELRDRYGQEYVRYCAQVPRFWPW
jgi:protein-S-isoprenylcysteine O-methyltransferase Ste14